MSRLKEILESGRAPGMKRSIPDERSPEGAVPRALKSLDGRQVRKLVRESGFSVDHFKRVWAMSLLIVAALGLGLPARATDINKGKTFLPGEQDIDHTDLNNLIDLATINTEFYTTKSSAVPGVSDIFLFARSGVFYRCTLNGLLVNNTNLITGQSEDATPATNDFLLTFDVSAGGFKKSQLDSLVFTNSGLIANRPETTNPGGGAYLLVLDGGTWGKVARSNLFSGSWTYVATAAGSFTNLAAQTAPTNADTLLLFDSAGGTNKTLTLTALQYWLHTNVTSATLTSTDTVPVFSGSAPKLTTIGDISNAVRQTTGFSAATLFTSAEYTLPGVGTVTNIAHGLAGTPQQVRWVVVCKTAELNYSVGDESDLFAWHDSGAFPGFGAGGNSTNVWISRSGSGALELQNKTTGLWGSAPTDANWRVKCYAVYYP